MIHIWVGRTVADKCRTGVERVGGAVDRRDIPRVDICQYIVPVHTVVPRNLDHATVPVGVIRQLKRECVIEGDNKGLVFTDFEGWSFDPGITDAADVVAVPAEALGVAGAVPNFIGIGATGEPWSVRSFDIVGFGTVGDDVPVDGGPKFLFDDRLAPVGRGQSDRQHKVLVGHLRFVDRDRDGGLVGHAGVDRV